LYAAYCGAKKVLAFEPNSEAFRCLVRNIEANQLQDVIVPSHAAVASCDGREVWIPTEPSAYNSVSTTATATAERVTTVSMATIARESGGIDLLKLDCEGSEYEILLETSPDVFRDISDIRLEYHAGRLDELERTLDQHRVIHWQQDSPQLGNIWYRR
jgi:FkbM family methyltransferase